MADIGVSRNRSGEVAVEHTGFRLSWGAIFAGFIVATVLQLVLSLFGIAIGFATWDPGDPARDLGMGAGIWFVLTAIISLIIGGLTTGRLAGILTRGDGAIHGVVMWSLSTLLAVWMAWSGATFLLGGVFGVLGRAAGATAGAVASGVAQVGTAAVTEAGDLDIGTIQREIEATLAATERPELQPDTLRADAEQIGTRTTGTATNEQVAREIQATIRDRAGAVDRQAIVNVLANRTDLSRAEAERVATRIENLATGAQQQIATAADTVGARAQQVAEDATEVVSRAAWWALLAMGLSLLAAVGGAATTARE